VTTWPVTTIGEVVTFQRGFDITKAEQAPGPFPVISSSGPASSHSNYKVEPPGVVIGRKGSLGGVYFATTPFWPHDTTLWVKDFHGNDPHFVYYWLQTLQLEHYDVGASNPTLNRNHLHGLIATVPPVGTQRRIAEVLSAYDALIENNGRRIKILDEMAQRIYREWFVDFRYPGHEKVTSIDSERGPIPAGWSVVKLNDVVTIDKGLSYMGAFLTEDGAPMANLKCIAPSGGFRREGTKPYSGPAKPKHKVVPGDVIMANTDLTQAGAVIGSPAIIPTRVFEGGGLISHHLFVVRPLDGRLTRAYLYYLLADDRFRDFARGRASGTTVLGFRASDCGDYRFPSPPAELVERFSRLVDPIIALADALRDAAETAGITRDLVLPRLISGDIDVTDPIDDLAA
jgi:type I restriction enzyme S subunit